MMPGQKTRGTPAYIETAEKSAVGKGSIADRPFCCKELKTSVEEGLLVYEDVFSPATCKTHKEFIIEKENGHGCIIRFCPFCGGVFSE